MEDLYERMKAHDETALDEFMNKYKNIFYHIVYTILGEKCGNSDIEDCLSESIIYIWYHIHQYDPEKYSLRNWASLIIRSRALNTLRDLNRIQEKQSKLKRIANSESTEDIYMATYTGQQILVYIESLKSPMREVVFLKCIKGQAPKQIARILNIEPAKVNYYLYEGLKKLKGMIGNV